MAQEARSLPNADTDVAKPKTVSKWVETCLNPAGDGKPHPNLAEELTDDDLGRIGQRVKTEYDLDKNSRADWEELTAEGMKLAKQEFEQKNTPWPKASSVKYPLITVAAMQFAARAYPEIVQGNEVVKCKVTGYDPDGMKAQKAQRISEHMSWQLLEEMESWEEEMDKLLHVLPVTGVCFKKIYFDATDKINRSDLCLPEDVVVHYRAKSMERARRVTHLLEYFQNDIFERVSAGVWIDADLPKADDAEHPGEQDAPHVFLEQHRFLDLDGDGYQEPYIVTVHKETSKVVRIIPRFDANSFELTEQGDLVRIRPIEYFVKYPFIPSPDGALYDIGFGTLLYPLNESVNSVLNQLVDAGTLANLQAGWVDKSLREKGGVQPFLPGEWRKTESKLAAGQRLSDKILPLPFKEPSVVLFQLLGMLIEAGEKVGIVKDVLSGKPPGSNVPATTVLALVEQGLKVFTGIHKRIFRALAQEYRKLFRLNGIYADPEKLFRVLDRPQQVFLADYNDQDLDVVPVADPNQSSDIERVAKAQALLQTVSGRPNVNEDEVTQRMIASIKVSDPEKLVIPQEQRQPPPPDPRVVIEMNKLQLEAARLELDKVKTLAGLEEMAAKIGKLEADSIKALAEAEAQELGIQMQLYMGQLKELGNVARERIKVIGQVAQGQQRQQQQGESQGPTRTPVESRQAGGPVQPQKPYVVGENGPELFIPDQGGYIVPEESIRTMSPMEKMMYAGDKAFSPQGTILERLDFDLGAPIAGPLQTVYHGTPHKWLKELKFPKGRPRLDKIGTGEGGAAYGHGWYSAEAEAVGKVYQSMDDAPEVWQLIDPVGKYSSEFSVRGGPSKEMVEEAKRKGWTLKQIKPPSKSGQLYKLDIPDEVMPKLMDWDKPLSEQSPWVKSKIMKAFKDRMIPTGLDAEGKGVGYTGEELYRELVWEIEHRWRPANAPKNPKKEASEFLQKLGIPGHRYLDQGSRFLESGRISKIGPNRWAATTENTARTGSMTRSDFGSEAEARKWLNEQLKQAKTYNYVIWDQDVLDQVKVLE